jgi:hypothetical protein
VKDTVEVDFNVSRHLDSELAAKDWDALVQFYSFLDAFSLVFSVVPENAPYLLIQTVCCLIR